MSRNQQETFNCTAKFLEVVQRGRNAEAASNGASNLAHAVIAKFIFLYMNKAKEAELVCTGISRVRQKRA